MGRLTDRGKEANFLTKLRHLYGQMPEASGSFEDFMENFDVDDTHTRKNMERIFSKHRHTSRGWVIGRDGGPLSRERIDYAGGIMGAGIGERRDRDRERAALHRTLRRSRLVSDTGDQAEGLSREERSQPGQGQGVEEVALPGGNGLWQMDFLFDGAPPPPNDDDRERDSAAYLRTMLDRLSTYRPQTRPRASVARRYRFQQQRQQQQQQQEQERRQRPQTQPQQQQQQEQERRHRPPTQPVEPPERSQQPQRSETTIQHQPQQQRVQLANGQPVAGTSILESLRSVPVDQLMSSVP